MERNVHIRVHKSPTTGPFWTQMTPVHLLKSYIFKINFNIILISTLIYLKWYKI
jgi:hypothetical protein